MNFQEFLKTTYYGNLTQDYLLGLIFLFIGFVLHGWLSGLIIRLISQIFKRSEYNLTYQEYKTHLQKSLNFFLFLIFLFLAFQHLDFPVNWEMAPIDEFGIRLILYRGYHLLIAIALTRIVMRIVVVFGQILMKKADKTVSKQDDQLIPFAVEVVKIIMVVIAILIVVGTIFELNIGSLVAGLGIGGLAIALAAKESLENLFGSFAIFFDKPFVVGDLVSVGDTTGVVEKVGFRSTRIRTLEKSYVTIPNKKMIDAELDNLSLRTFRRVKFNVGLVYGTKAEVMKKISERIRKFLLDNPHTSNDVQVRFSEFGSSSLDILILYYIDTMDFDLYLQYKEEINYTIMEIVEEEGSDFAFPTQTIHLQKGNS